MNNSNKSNKINKSKSTGSHSGTKEVIKKEEKSVTQEYLEYHEHYVKKFGKDRTLVLMQVGKFYEAYATTTRGPDLTILEELTEASIAHKGKNKEVIDIQNPLMWGFPMLASLKYINILIENGYRLIMIDQVTPKPNIRREVVAIHSPGTYLETTYRPASNFVSVIYLEEIKQKNTHQLLFTGMSAIDVSTGVVYVHESFSQLNDDKLGLDETIRFLNSLSPKEIIIIKENITRLTDDYIVEYLDLEGKFYQIKDAVAEHNKISYQKALLEKIYPERENMTSIIDTLGLSRTTYARKAIVNLLLYIGDHYYGLLKGISEPVFYLGNDYMVLGNDAINQLNIIDSKFRTNAPGSVKFHNLLDVVNKASTAMGKRYVKFRLVSPYTDPSTITSIYDAVDIMLQDDNYETLRDDLVKIHDIERLYKKLTINLLHPMQIVDFINSFVAIEELLLNIKSIKQLEKRLKVSGTISIVNKLNKLLSDTIDVDKAKAYTLTEIKENIFVKGVYPELDALQEKVGDNHDIMEELLLKLEGMITDRSAKNSKIVLKHNNNDGYYYQLTTRRYNLLKENLDKIQKIELTGTTINVADFETTATNNTIKLSLPFLKDQTDDIDELIEKIMNKTHSLYINLMTDICKKYGLMIEKMIDLITKIDYYVTIAKVAKNYNYVRPLIVDDQNQVGYIKAEQLRHPIVERIVDHEYVPHDIEVGHTSLKGMLIYGLNSAGKSVLMKSIGISAILAQAGFFVPAKSYIFYPYKALYTRITGDDNLFRGLSSFSLEMVELNSILKRSDEMTLVIGDEVCRGTEHISGNGIVAATLLHLSEVGSSFVFATHLHELMELEEIRQTENIKAFHLSVEHDEKSDRLVYDRLLKPGSGERIYGITVAKYIIKDEKFIKKALEIKNILTDREKDSVVVSTKKSRYNSELLMDRCTLCGVREGEKKNGKSAKSSMLETHHINHQKDCVDGFVKDKPHIQKNQIFNLVVLCQQCHDKIHCKDIEIEGIKMTSNGRKIVVKNSTKN